MIYHPFFAWCFEEIVDDLLPHWISFKERLGVGFDSLNQTPLFCSQLKLSLFEERLLRQRKISRNLKITKCHAAPTPHHINIASQIPDLLFDYSFFNIANQILDLLFDYSVFNKAEYQGAQNVQRTLSCRHFLLVVCEPVGGARSNTEWDCDWFSQNCSGQLHFCYIPEDPRSKSVAIFVGVK